MSLEGMRDLLKGTLGRSLGALRDEDRLVAAWPVACGKAMAERGIIVGYADGVMRVQVENGTWLRQLMSMRHNSPEGGADRWSESERYTLR